MVHPVSSFGSVLDLACLLPAIEHLHDVSALMNMNSKPSSTELVKKGISICLLGVGLFTTPVSSFAQEDSAEFLVLDKDRYCPEGKRLMSLSFAQKHTTQICNSLQNWTTARLAGDASFSGPANNCEILEVDPRSLNASLCVPLRDFSTLRGVLLNGGLRTQNELNTMSEQDWRAALITELANRTGTASAEYAGLSNPALAGAGALFVHLKNTGSVTPQALADYTLEDMRRAVVFELNKQTGMPVSTLATLSDLELIDLFLKG